MLIKIGSALIDPEEIAAVSPYSDETLSALEKATHVCIVFKQGESLWIDATMDEAEAALIDAGVVTDLTDDPPQDEDAAPELSAFEIEELCKLYENEYRYMARDKDGKLYAYRRKPEYGGFYWSDPGPGGAGALQVCDFAGFKFIGEDDSEPTKISELLNDPS